MATTPTIMPVRIDDVNTPIFKQHSIHDRTAKQITATLGFKSNVGSGDGKSRHHWQFTIEGKHAAVWDYKGSELLGKFSAWGDAALLATVFGEHFKKDLI